MNELKIIATEKAPQAIGHYVQGMTSDKLIITSGQIPVVPETGKMISEPGEAMTQVLKNITAIVEKAGGAKNTIARVDIFMTDIKNFAVMNAAYAKFFGSHKPTRLCVEVKGLPAGAVVEASALAFVKD